MKEAPENKEREERITMEIIVDAYSPDEQAMGWYYYLESHLNFPLRAKCVSERVISPLRIGEEVEVVGMAGEEECMHEMFVMTTWNRRRLAIPLAQVEGVAVDDETRQAIEDWHYWL